MNGLIRECLACEKSYAPLDALKDGVQIKFSGQYCSKACEDSFEEFLAQSAAEAKLNGLITEEGIPIVRAHSMSEQPSANSLNELIKHFSTRIPEKK